AHLYLADALVKTKEFKDAIPHYEAYLALIGDGSGTAETSGPLPPPEYVLKVVIQLAVTCRNAGEDDTAVHFFDQAATLANKAGDKEGLAFALIRAAEIKAGHGNAVASL